MAQTELDPSFCTYRRHARHPGQPEVLVGLVERVPAIAAEPLACYIFRFLTRPLQAFEDHTTCFRYQFSR